MKSLNRKDFPGPRYPTRVIQFGEGNFLRAFIDWQLDLLNEQTDLAAGVTIIRPINTEFPPSLNIGTDSTPRRSAGWTNAARR